MKTLREWRIEQLMTQADLATRAGVSKRTVIQTELGRQLPALRTIRDVSAALGIPPRDIAEFARALDTRSAIPDSAPQTGLPANEGTTKGDAS